MSLEINNNVRVIDPSHKVYSHESYAQELYDMYTRGNALDSVGKDLSDGQIIEVTKFVGATGSVITLSNGNAIDIPIDLTKEKRFLNIHNTNIEEFILWLQFDHGASFLNERQFVEIESAKDVRASLLGGFGYKLRHEFNEQLKNPTKAYTAKVISKNGGGFIIDILGVKGFLPGSLAAANIVKDFDKFVGSTVNVMVESYIENIQTFVFSNKKYVEHVLPSRIEELDKEVMQIGRVTGTTKFGIFIEIDEIFTGLLHATKMNKETFDAFKSRKYKAGDEISCYIKEVSDKNRLVLTTFTPKEQKDFEKKIKRDRNEKFISSINFNKNDIYKAKVTNVKMFGTFVQVEYGKKLINGMVLNDSSKSYNEECQVKFVSQDKNKFYFKFA